MCLIRDRDAVYGADFVRKAAGLGIRTVLAPVRVLRANAVAERLVGTLRRECLDQVIVVNEQHLRAVLAEFARHYNAERPHRTLLLETPIPVAPARAGPIRSRPVLGGLQHTYERAARSDLCAPTGHAIAESTAPWAHLDAGWRTWTAPGASTTVATASVLAGVHQAHRLAG